MLKLVEMDQHVTFAQQLEQDGDRIILINRFTVAAEDVEHFLRAWTADAALMKQQPGFVSAQLHRGVGGSCVFLNYAVWESLAAFKNAFNKPDFQASLQRYPSSTVACPHIFQKVAVPGVCGDR